MTTYLLVEPGACGIKTTIKVEKQDHIVSIKVRSECNDVIAFASSLRSLTINEALKPIAKNRIYKEASNFLKHPSCPIPCAVLKAIEAELGLTLKKDVHFTFCNEVKEGPPC